MKKIILNLLIGLFLLNSAYYSLEANAQETKHSATSVEKQTSKVYVNKFYKFQINLPLGWNEIAADDSSTLLEIGKETNTKLTRKGKQDIDNSVKRTDLLLHYTKYPIGSAKNSSFICAIEKIPSTQATTKAISLFSQLNFKQHFGYEIIKPTSPANLAGKNFYYFTMRKDNLGVIVNQKLYMAKLNDTEVFQFVFTYFSEEDLFTMEEAVKTLKFIK